MNNNESIRSANINELTDGKMIEIKQSIKAIYNQKQDLAKKLADTESSLKKYKLKRFLSKFFLFEFFSKSYWSKLLSLIQAKEIEKDKLMKDISECTFVTTVEEPHVLSTFSELATSFRYLSSSAKIWDVTNRHFHDASFYRSPAGTLVSKKEIVFGFGGLPFINSNSNTIWLRNANGADLYIYPTFLVMFADIGNFAVISLKDIQVHQNDVRFVEDGSLPPDTKVLEMTWAKVNNNGTPDRRFKNNYQIPIVKYGELHFSSVTGLNEKYYFSNYEHTEYFKSIFDLYKGLL